MTDIEFLVWGGFVFGLIIWVVPGIVGGLTTAIIIYRVRNNIGFLDVFFIIAFGWTIGWVIGGIAGMIVPMIVGTGIIHFFPSIGTWTLAIYTV